MKKSQDLQGLLLQIHESVCVHAHARVYSEVTEETSVKMMPLIFAIKLHLGGTIFILYFKQVFGFFFFKIAVLGIF